MIGTNTFIVNGHHYKKSDLDQRMNYFSNLKNIVNIYSNYHFRHSL